MGYFFKCLSATDSAINGKFSFLEGNGRRKMQNKYYNHEFHVV